MNVHTVISKPFDENTYLVWADDGATGAVVIDPGFEPEPILDFLRGRDLSPVAILNTHGHVDHIAGNAAVKALFPDAPIIIGRNDAVMLTDPIRNLSGLSGVPVTSPPADRTVSEGDELTLIGLTWEVLDIPGHSPGHVVFVVREGEAVTVFGGDVLFAGSIGRTDFPGGDHRVLLAGIRSKLWPLPDATTVYPGHNEPTTVGREKATNPFLS